MSNLCGILEDFASDEYAEKLGAGLTGHMDSDEMLNVFDDAR